MKILIVRNASTKYDSPFGWTLIEALRDIGVDVTCSVQELWTNWKFYDIIHFQWPDCVLKLGKTTRDLESTVSDIKKLGIKILVTVHNFKPHYCNDKEKLGAYDIVYRNADCFVHLGNYSYSLYQKKYPDAKHCVILHHVYSRIYNRFPSKEEAFAKLGLDTRYKYILCLGTFRASEERIMILNLARALYQYGYKIVAPSFFKLRKGRRYFLQNLITKISRFLTTIFNPFLIIGPEYVPFEDVPYYYSVSDIALIQRKHILNSGNVPMAFLFGKVVVGPDVGNVGPWLKATGNPTFNPSIPKSLVNAVKEAEELIKNGVGERNKEYALTQLDPEMIAGQYQNLYRSVFINKG